MNDDLDIPRPHPRAGDADVLALAEGLVASLGKTFNCTDLQVLRTVAQSYPDEGRDGAGEVVASLDGLLADFLAAETYDREAIVVHVRAWRFMVSCRPDERERLRLMSGLQDVRDLYGESRAA